jgi:hypothetical protein
MFNNLRHYFINLDYVNYFNIDKNYITTLLTEVYTYLQQYNSLSDLLVNNNEIDASSENVVVKVNINNKSYISYKKLYDELNYYLYNKGYLHINNFLYISLYFVFNGFYVLGDLYINKLKETSNNLTKDKITEIYNKVLNDKIFQDKLKTLPLERINGSNKAKLLYYYNNTIFQESCEKDYLLGCYYYYFENDVNNSLKYFNNIINNYPYNKPVSELNRRLRKYSMINMHKIYEDIYNNKIYFEDTKI